MVESTGRQGSRITRGLRISGIALLLVAAGCSNSSTGGDPSIHAKQDRSKSGTLDALTVEGKHFTPNGPVLVTVLMAGTGANASPYVEETIQADANGKIKYEKRPVACPQPPTYGSGSWTLVTARDMTSGISGSAGLNPGDAPDCKS